MDKIENERLINELETNQNNSSHDYKILVNRLKSMKEIIASLRNQFLKKI